MAMNLVKTTVTIPEDLLRMAKLKAVQEKTTVSDLIRDGLKTRLQRPRMIEKKDPMRLAGRFRLGSAKIYNKRSDLYDDHILRKMGL